MKVLVTGGCGYIGSHTVVELIQEGNECIIVDDLSNSSEKVLDRIEEITGIKPIFFNLNILDAKELGKIFHEHNIDAVIHFAAFKSVGESVKKPLEYYRNNIDGLLSMLENVNKYKVKQVIFSSSATVYGTPEEVPLIESSRVGLGITNPYGQSKFMCEQILMDYSKSMHDTAITILRYFNPAGAHPSGLIGEDPNDIPNNLMPFVSQVAVGKLKKVMVFGDDYKTVDGTGVRDYIHVVDLAKGHLAALAHSNHPTNEPAIYNLGTGHGYSVLQVINEFSKASGIKIPYEITSRRPGDVASCYANSDKAKRELSWSTQKTLKQMCEDSWNWQRANPNGYSSQ